MKNILKHALIGAVTLVFILINQASGQELVAVKDSLQSDLLKENRKIEVFLPKDYKTGSVQKYDVIYVLDGEWNTGICSQMMQYLANQGFLPTNIIVSVPNTYVNGFNERDRDFTPTHTAGMNGSGGADIFLSFLKNELIPFVKKRYQSTGKNMVFGQSLGGLFAMYSLLKEPSLFQSYLLADPSFWYDNNFMIKLAAEKLSGLKNEEISLWVVGREGESSIGQGIVAMDSVLKLKAPVEMHWTVKEEPYETHVTTQLKTLYDGLRFAYRGYVPNYIAMLPAKGIVLAGKPFRIWCFNSFVDNMHYTIDGSDPVLAAAKMQNQLTLTLQSSAKLIVKAFCNRPEYNKTTSADFEVGNAFPAEPKPKGVQSGGLHYQYFEGDWDKLPNFDKLIPLRSGLANKDVDVSKLSGRAGSAFLFKGYLEIKQDGYYTFLLSGSDGSKFFIEDKLIIDNTDQPGMPESKSFVIPLTEGFYRVKFEAFRKKGSDDFSVIYNTPGNGTNLDRIPLEVFYGKN